MLMYCMVYIEPLEISILYGGCSVYTQILYKDNIDGYYIVCNPNHPIVTK